MKSLTKIAAMSLLTLASAMRVMAQAEVNPDHFPDEATPVAAVRPEIQAEIEQQKERVNNYEAQLKAKAALVEESRNEAMSAGMQGDGAGSFIDAYNANVEEFEALRASLTPRITMALQTIASLEAGNYGAELVARK